MAASVLITGAGGLIGSLVLRHWSDPAFAPVPVRSADIDLLVPGAAARLVETVRPDLVVHLAWCASGPPATATPTTTPDGSPPAWSCVTACRATGTAFWPTGTVVDREDSPVDAYAAAKTELRRRLDR